MDNFPKWMWVVVLIVVVGGGWYLLNGKTPQHEGPVKIGVILPMTGDAAVYGEPLAKLIQLAVDEVNAAGGVGGEQAEVIIEDGKCDGTAAANAAQKLINVDGVEVILGAFCSSESLSVVPIAEAAKVAVISPGSSSPKLTGISEYFVRNYPSDSTQGSVLANIAYNDKGWKKVAFLQEQTDYALGVYTAFTETFTKLGGTVTKEEFPSEMTDFRSIITKARAGNPDAVFVDTQTPAVAVRVLTQMDQIGWKAPLLVSDIVPGDPATVTGNAALLEGAIGAEFGVNADNSKFKAMVAAYEAKYGGVMPYQGYGQTVYDGVFLIRDAINAGGYDGTKIAHWLRTEVKDWEGAAGSTTIGSNGDPITGHRAEVIMGGRVVPYVK